MYLASIAFFLSGIACCAGAAAEPNQRQCFSTVETRNKIAADGLSEPFAAMRHAATHSQAEPIGARLCRWDDDFVYEISLLRRDGRVVRSFIDAKSGELRDQDKSVKSDAGRR